MELGSVTRAAEAMAITQSAASRLVLRLQDEVGFALFRKAAGRLQSTPEGQALFEEARRAFLGLREVEIAAQRIRQVGTGNLRVCMMPTLAQGLLPERIASFHRAHPSTAITLDVRPNAEVIPAVRGGSSELGFAALPIADPTMPDATHREQRAGLHPPARPPARREGTDRAGGSA
jgi:DNA-binding transcriptional LysR family regulator